MPGEKVVGVRWSGSCEGDFFCGDRAVLDLNFGAGHTNIHLVT